MNILYLGTDRLLPHTLGGAGFHLEMLDYTEREDFDLEDWLIAGGSEFQCVVLDIDGGIGVMACRGVRRAGIMTPVIGLSSEPSEGSWSEHRTKWLDNGGDDLLKKPVNWTEVVASVRATIRRNTGILESVKVLKRGSATLIINETTQSCKVNDRPLNLTGKETQILIGMSRRFGKIVPKEQLMSFVYGLTDDEPEIKIIDVFVCKLRAKLKRMSPDAGRMIETVWGRGYRLIDGAKLREEEVFSGAVE